MSSSHVSVLAVDANLAVNFAVPTHPYHHQARRFFTDHAAATLIAPPLFEAEADTALRRMVHRGALSLNSGRNAQTLLDTLPIQIVYEPGVRSRARAIAEAANLPRVYDATYAALAELRRCDLWTADERFFNAVHAGLPFVRFIGHY